MATPPKESPRHRRAPFRRGGTGGTQRSEGWRLFLSGQATAAGDDLQQGRQRGVSRRRPQGRALRAVALNVWERSLGSAREERRPAGLRMGEVRQLTCL